MIGQRLASGHDSLARGVADAAPGAIFALALTEGVTVGPREGLAIRFGRNRPDVDVCVGEDDLKVSRLHGVVTYRRGLWWVSNQGQLPIRMPRSQLLFGNAEPTPLTSGYTPLFIRGSRGREHLLELYVAGPDGGHPAPQHGAVTEPPRRWRLTPDERLALVVVGQRYLLHEEQPLPIARQQACLQLEELQPDTGWTVKKLDHTISDVRTRLSRAGVSGLTREEVGEPVGNTLNDNLLRELVLSTTLVPTDLALLDFLS